MGGKIEVPLSNIPGANIKEIKIIVDIGLTGTKIHTDTPFDPLTTIGFMEIAKTMLIAQGSQGQKVGK